LSVLTLRLHARGGALPQTLTEPVTVRQDHGRVAVVPSDCSRRSPSGARSRRRSGVPSTLFNVRPTRGILTVRFTMAGGGGLAGNFIMTFSGPCLMTVRNFSRTVLTCSMRHRRTMSVRHYDDRMADNACLGMP
jgi:hypothetical protein